MSGDKPAIAYECEHLIARAARAYGYLMGTLDEDGAAHIIIDCQPAAGWFALETLSVDTVYQDALDARWHDHPELRRLCAEAAQRVSEKWSSTGDTAAAASDWALQLVQEYADSDGVELVRLDD